MTSGGLGGSGRRLAMLVRPDPADARGRRVRPQVSKVTNQVIGRLEVAGAIVDVVCPEAQPWDLATLRPEYDLYVLKSKNPLVLSLAGALEALGGRCLNTAQSSRYVKDKLLHTPLLAQAGVPLPPSYAAGSLAALRALLAAHDGKALVKAPGGSMAKGIFKVRRSSDLHGEKLADIKAALVDEFEQPRPMLVQGEVPSSGLDLKVYVAGEWVAAIERPFPARTEQEKRGRPVELPAPIREAALTCGRALGLEIYGVDFLTHGDVFWVVDVNAFPSYKGIDGAVERLADLILARARR